MTELFLVNPNMVDLGVGTAGLVALLGYLVVFIGLIALMVVIMIVGKIMVGKQAKAKAAATAEKPAQTSLAAAPAEKPSAPEAPGTAGELKLYGTSDRDAALIMAIVAHKMGKPLNTLRFKSIKEVQ